jgi:hypothetical protein
MGALVLYTLGVIFAFFTWKAFQDGCVFYRRKKYNRDLNPVLFQLLTFTYIMFSLVSFLLGIFWTFN